MRARLPRAIGFTLVALLLLGFTQGYRYIPYGPFWGLDFQNLWTFHHCAEANSPYQATGAACGDAERRDMFYPPLLYWLFSWTRLVDFFTAREGWTLAIVVGIFFALTRFIRRSEWSTVGEVRLATFLLLLLLQYPVAFSVERGNNDVLVLLGWSLALALFMAGRAGLAGVLAGLVTAAKLYPVLAFAVIFAALVWEAARARKLRSDVLWAVAGFAAAGLVTSLALFFDLRDYLTDEFPRFADRVGPLAIFSHSLPHLIEGKPWAGKVAAWTILVIWSVAAARRIRVDPPLIFAGALALSTTFAGVSFDYNLITALPLSMVLFLRAFGERIALLPMVLLLLGLVAICGQRLFPPADPDFLRARLVIQCVWLAATAVWASFARPPEPAAHSPSVPLPIRKT